MWIYANVEPDYLRVNKLQHLLNVHFLAPHSPSCVIVCYCCVGHALLLGGMLLLVLLLMCVSILCFVVWRYHRILEHVWPSGIRKPCCTTVQVAFIMFLAVVIPSVGWMATLKNLATMIGASDGVFSFIDQPFYRRERKKLQCDEWWISFRRGNKKYKDIIWKQTSI